MCGILGYISTNINLDEFQIALDSINHRGPDDGGIFEDEGIVLGHRRLSIQDISNNAHQPMQSEDGRYVLVFNGEIYNHVDIRESLKNKYRFMSSGDSETLLYGYIEYGKDILNMVNGIFAFAVYDTELKEIFIARDQLGVKPLYYFNNNNNFIFGSEIKSFIKFESFSNKINERSFLSYTNLLWSPGVNTPFENVKKLKPGHYISFKLSDTHINIEPVKYYEIPFHGIYRSKPETELIDELDQLLNTVVKSQLLSDVPVGFFLSGGLDSSLLVAIAKKYLRNTIQTFTIRSSDIESEGFVDDLMYAKKVAEHLNVKLEIVEAEIDIIKDFGKMIWYLDEPQADAAPLNVGNICLRSKQMGYKVLIGGAGGDDLFSGYRRHQTLNYHKYIDKTPVFIRNIVKNVIYKLPIPGNALRRLKKGLNNIELSRIERLASYFSWLDMDRNKQLFKSKEVFEWPEPKQYFIDMLSNIPYEKDDLNKMLYWEMKTFLVDHNLNYTDKMSMAHGVEVRVPYLDKNLVEFATGIPPEMKLKGKTTKYLLKKVAERYLPLDVIYRPKTGFGAPIRKWITTEMDELISTYLSREQLESRGIFNPEKVWELVEENKKGIVDASYTIWSLLAIESWFRQFVDIDLKYETNPPII